MNVQLCSDLDESREMDLLDLRVKKETEDSVEPKVNAETLASRVTWDQWAYPDQWVNRDRLDLTDLQAFLVKWAQWAKMVRRENVVIWAQWAILASKVRKVIRVIQAAGAALAHRVCPVAQATSQIVIKPLRIY